MALLRAELLSQLLPIYQRRAQRAARGIGPFADGAEIESRVIERVWRVIEQDDLQDANALGRLLSVCESRARKDASRAADHLARATRSMHRSYTTFVDREAQRVGRALTYTERMNGARSVAPEGTSSSQLQRIVAGSPAVMALDDLLEGVAVTASHTDCSPESTVIEAEDREAVWKWLEELPRRADRRILARRLTGEHPMSAPLSQHLRERAIRHGGDELIETVLTK